MFNQILLTVLANTQVMKEKKINDLYQEMKDSLQRLGEADQSQKSATQRAYLKAFMNVMKRMSDELLEARQKYEDLDKQKLKLQKCLKLAEDIKIFRQQCYTLKKTVKDVGQATKKEKLKADMLERQQDGLKKAIEKVSMDKNRTKQKYEKLKSMMESSEGGQNIEPQKRAETAREKCKTPLPIATDKASLLQMWKNDAGQDKRILYRARPRSTLQNYEKRKHF